MKNNSKELRKFFSFLLIAIVISLITWASTQENITILEDIGIRKYPGTEDTTEFR